MAEPIISVSGLRGIIGDSLTPELAARYACAFATTAPEGKFVITRDGRSTGPMLADGILSALRAVGRTCIYADVAATPTTGVLIRQYGAAGGIQISASHNPPQYNGLKLFSGEGRVLTSAAGAPVMKQYREGTPPWVSFDKIGDVETAGDAHEKHLDAVLATIDVERIRAQKFRVYLDSNHGAGSLLGRRLLEALGCEVTIGGDTPDGQFEHTPEPTAENLAGVSKHVSSMKAAVGFCQDPDADRLALIDETGTYVGEEYTLAICVDHVLQRTPGPVVTNCSTSRMSQDLAEKYGVPFCRSAVGEANVVDVMLANEAVFGGEGNGGPIDPRVGLVRDSFVGMALVLDVMAAREMSLSALATELPRYEICKTKVTLPKEKVAAALDALEKHASDATADRMDGLRLDWPGKWLLVRASNTEPIVRAVAEATSAEEAEALCAMAAEVMSKV